MTDPERLLTIMLGILVLAIFFLALYIVSGLRRVDWVRVAVRTQRAYINLPNMDKRFLMWYGRAWYVVILLFLAGIGMR